MAVEGDRVYVTESQARESSLNTVALDGVTGTEIWRTPSGPDRDPPARIARRVMAAV